MPREIVIASWCDVCWIEQIRTGAVSSIEFGRNGTAYHLDVCSQHEDPRWSQIIEHAIRSDAPTPEPVRPRGARIPCPVPGCATTTVNRQGMANHMGRTHRDLSYGERHRLAGFTTPPKREN